MIRGTTPTLVFTFPFETSVIKKLWLTFYQHGNEILTLNESHCKFDDGTVKVTLSQNDTLRLAQNTTVDFQFRVLTQNDLALASNVMTTAVQRILKDGEI